MALKSVAQKITAREKLMAVNKAMGNPVANESQGTTFTIYDSLPLDGTTNTFKFFQQTTQKPLVLSNLTQGLLQAGESISILTMQIQFVEYNDPANNDFTVVAIFPLSASLQFQQATGSFFYSGSQVSKDIPLQEWVDIYNADAQITGSNVMLPKNIQTITSFLRFYFEVTTPVSVNVANTYAKMYLSGLGGLYLPKVNS